MAYIIYITQSCQEEANKHNYKDALEKLKTAVESKQSTSQLHRFGSSPYLVKKQFGDFRGRLITYEKLFPLENREYTVIVFLKIFVRGNKEYTEFQSDPLKYGEKFLKKLNDDDIKTYLKTVVAENPPQSKPALTQEEEEYLYDSKILEYDLDSQPLIYESEEWVKNIKQEPFISILPRIYDTVKNILENDYTANAIEIYQRKERIVFDKSKDHLSLIDLDRREPISSDGVAQTVSQWQKNIGAVPDAVKRAYPQYILADESMWMDIEKDPQSNFVLAKEEIEILSSCKKDAFPLFINGRAGSGKSTILQYIFADYFSRYLSYKDAIQYPPAYFTYNSELLQRAKTFVKNLITCNAAFSQIKEILFKHGAVNDSLNEKLEESFKELKTYLLSLIQKDPDNTQFIPANYVSYTRFHALWSEKYKADKKAAYNYSPDISWHVIRTYIQGIDVDGYLEPDDYSELEEKQKTVSKDTFQLVYTKVWKWYQDIKQQNKLWDDQDLVRFVIERDLAEPVFPGVFCDEAQDFTRIEMEVILRFSLFSNRDIQKQHISRIPFAFAGDELQTLNPTGFRWDALKAEFTQKFILSLSSEYISRSKTNLNYRVLENNYRSSPSIVKFCNMLQLFRAVKFGILELRPQKPWNVVSDMPVVSFLSDTAYFWEGVQKLPDTVFIIPCNEGEEIEWIKNNIDMQKHIKIEDGVPNVPVLSANLAKGLEFNRVVVYGFGMEVPADLNKTGEESITADLPLEYYINKTYVAISRAKKQLYIVDSQCGIERFWNVMQDQQAVHTRLETINAGSGGWFTEDLFFLIQGNKANLSDQNEINIEENALQFKQNGMASRNSYMLRQAARIYRELERADEADRCEATAFVFEKQYLEAGKKYNDSGWTEETVKSLWMANCKEGYETLVRVVRKKPAYAFFFQIASSMLRDFKTTLVETITMTASLSKEQVCDIFKSDDIFIEAEMLYVLTQLINSVVKKVIPYINSDDTAILQKIIAIHKQKVKIDCAAIAEIAYILKEYKTAVEYWDISEYKDKEKYTHAKAYASVYPENIASLRHIGDWNAVITQYTEHGNIPHTLLHIVIEAFMRQNKTDKALQLSSAISGKDNFGYLYELSVQRGNKKATGVFSLLKKLETIREEHWDSIYKLLIEEKSVADILYLSAGLARTHSLVSLNETGHSPTKRDISAYLHEAVIKKNLYRHIPQDMLFDIGTAIEKAGRRTDALEYYEQIESYLENATLRQICIERWIITKERQAEQNSATSNWAVKRREEASEKRIQSRIPSDKKIPEYLALSDWREFYQNIISNDTAIFTAFDAEPMPSKGKQQALFNDANITAFNAETPHTDAPAIPAITGEKPANTDTEIPPKTYFEFDIEGYEFKYFYQKKRLNITNKTDGSSVSITKDAYASGDYTVKMQEDYQHIEQTPILFQNNREYITIRFNTIPLKIEVGKRVE
jgi:hypothetical protein